MESKAYLLADPQYKGEVNPEHFGGCYVPEVRKKNKEFCPHTAWGRAMEELGIYENKKEVEEEK